MVSLVWGLIVIRMICGGKGSDSDHQYDMRYRGGGDHLDDM